MVQWSCHWIAAQEVCSSNPTGDGTCFRLNFSPKKNLNKIYMILATMPITRYSENLNTNHKDSANNSTPLS